MFCSHRRRQKKCQDDVGVGDAEFSNPQKSDNLPTDKPERQPTPTGHCGGPLAKPLWTKIYGHLTKPFTSASTKTTDKLVSLGFPNLSQTCYMNSTLQGLLTLKHFVQEVQRQQQVWSFHPKSKLLRQFVKVGHNNNNEAKKRRTLTAFKRTVAKFNSEFKDHSQKDAHEFLISVLQQLRSLSIDLQGAAMDVRYTCPVNAHITLQMSSMRTCKGCGVRSRRDEDHIILSLALVPGGSVSQCLQEYLKETPLEYRCECGAKESVQQGAFVTLPNVLILQLKRFRFSPSFKLEKVYSFVDLSRELLVVRESCPAKKATRYTLVSIVSHLGSAVDSGHYICDGVQREHGASNMDDCWFTYDDMYVIETTGESVCRRRRRSAYLLFYVKKAEESHDRKERPEAQEAMQQSSKTLQATATAIAIAKT